MDLVESIWQADLDYSGPRGNLWNREVLKYSTSFIFYNENVGSRNVAWMNLSFAMTE